MASASLQPLSAEELFLFVVPKRLRAFRNYFFTEKELPFFFFFFFFLRILPKKAGNISLPLREWGLFCIESLLRGGGRYLIYLKY